MSLSLRTRRCERGLPAVAAGSGPSAAPPVGAPPQPEEGGAAARELLRLHDTARVEELVAHVQQRFEDSLAVREGEGEGTPTSDALRACEELLGALRRDLAEALSGGERREVAAFQVAQFRLRFEQVFLQLCQLPLTEEDELAIVSAAHAFDLRVGSVSRCWGGANPPPPLHTVPPIAALMERLSPFCEGCVLHRPPGCVVWQRRWAVLELGRLALYTSRLGADAQPEHSRLHLSLGAVRSIEATDALRSLTLVLEPADEAAACEGLRVSEAFGRLEIRLDMAPDYQAWREALCSAQEAAPRWAAFRSQQPQWSALAPGGASWRTQLAVAAQDAAEVGDGVCRWVASSAAACGDQTRDEPWWEDETVGGRAALLRSAVDSMLSLVSDELATHVTAHAPSYWQPGEDDGEGLARAERLSHACAELLRQVSASAEAVSDLETGEERRRLGG